MKRAVRRAVCCVYDRRISFSPPVRTLPSSPLLARFAALTPPQLRFCSSGNDQDNGSNLSRAENKDSLVDDDVSTEELKKRIDRFYGGNMESLPSIFEAILKRKLSGRHEEADDELMKEIRQRMPGQVETSDDSDLDELQEIDEETEDSSDAEEDGRKA